MYLSFTTILNIRRIMKKNVENVLCLTNLHF
nr:MAG TPA: hypothetical protein [Caudoviricetes sp.]